MAAYCRFGLMAATALWAALIPICSIAASAAAQGASDIASRKSSILAAEAGHSRQQNCQAERKKASGCSLALLSHALAGLSLGAGKDEITSMDRQIAVEAAAFAVVAPDGQMQLERRAGPIRDERDSSAFHLNFAATFYRLMRLFGAHGSKTESLSKPTQSAIVDAFWNWASQQCARSDAQAAHVWEIVGSENHTALFDGACWAAADLLSRDDAYAKRRYRDGSSAAEQLAAWTRYTKLYLRERARHGLFVEYYSPTYAKYTLLNLYLYADFGTDAELRRLAGNALQLWWAQWAVEQVDGMHGGSKARAYFETMDSADPMWDAAWMYFGFHSLRTPEPNQPLIAMATSDYEPLPIISALALDAAGRGRYEVKAVVRGRTAPQSIGARGAVQVAPRDGDILRYSYVTPQFAMGLAEIPKLPHQQWITGSAQNRWAGLVFSGSQTARIVFSTGGDGINDYNGLWGVQSKAAQLVQALPKPLSANAEPLRVWLPTELSRTERGGWVFVENSAYVAIRPASGAYRWDSNGGSWLVPDDPAAVVVLQAASKSDYPDFKSFQDAVLAAPLSSRDGVVDYAGLGGAGRLRLYAASDRLPEIDGKPLVLDQGYSIDSPFLSGGGAKDSFTIRKGSDSQTLDFR